jgi:excisionase family DNA binding protein
MSVRAAGGGEQLRVDQVAAELKVSEQAVRKWIKGGELPATRTGHAWRVRREDLDEMIARQEDPDLIGADEIARELKVTTQTVRNWIKAGELPATRIKHAWRVRREDLDEMIARQQGESMTLGVHRDPWNPQTLGSPFRRREKPQARARSVWDSQHDPIVLAKRG